MKIKNIFESETINDETIMVSMDNKEFNGLIRANSTAAFILTCLKEDITEEEIVNKLIHHYGIEESIAKKDVAKIIRQLSNAGLVENEL